MTSARVLQKYLWLLRTIQSGPITRREIDDRWSRASINLDHDTCIPESSFHHQRKEVEILFGVTIACNRDGGYYIEDSNREMADLQQWMLSSLAIGNTLQECESLRGRILLEKIPGGTQYLSAIIDAMENNFRLIVLYGSFTKDPREIIFSPYALKVFKQRWYMVGESSAHPGETRVYALDRIMQLSATNSRFTLPKGFNAEKHFANYFGVTVDDKIPVQDIRIRVARAGVPYLRTLPLHKSQKEVETTADYSVFQFRLAPTYEFRQEILSRLEEVEVLSPQSLRDEIGGIITALNNMYNK